MPTPFTGGCACGAIRYACSAEPLFMGKCHCRDCQRASGSAFNATLAVPASALTITKGEPKYYTVTAESGNALSRGFCPECGSPLFGKPAEQADLIGIKAASLDDPSWFRPVLDIWTASAHPWDYMNPDLPKFEKQPTAEQFQASLSSRG